MSKRVVHCKTSRYDVYIGRPGPWGNPFGHKSGTLAETNTGSRAAAIASYREWLLAQPDLVAKAKHELRGKVLGCWCSPYACHGDVLAEIANAEEVVAVAEPIATCAWPSTKLRGFDGRKVVCLDTEYDARYSDVGVARLSCMTYSLGPESEAQIVGPAEAVELWLGWVRDPSVFVMGHALNNDAAVLSQEAAIRSGAPETVPGCGEFWELAHQLYDDGRVIDTEIRQRLTHIRYGPEKASPQLGMIAARWFGLDMSDAKSVPDEAQALLLAATPYEEWPTDVLAKTPWRVKFGWLLETYGEDVSAWPKDAVDYAMDDVRLPWDIYRRQQIEWDDRTIPDLHNQILASWRLHVLSIPGWVADQERAQSIRTHYVRTIGHCERLLERHEVLVVEPTKQVTKRAKVQAAIIEALGDAAPLSKLKAKELPEPSALERLQFCATDTKTVKLAITATGGKPLSLADFSADALASMVDAPESFACALREAGCAAVTLNAVALWKASRAALKKLGDVTPWNENAAQAAALARLEALCEPLLVDAGLVDIVNKRTMKSGRVADYIFAVLGDDSPMTETGEAECPNPTPAQRREFCATDKKAVRQAILDCGIKKVIGVADAVEQSELPPAEYDAWLREQTSSRASDVLWPEVTGEVLTTVAVHKTASKVITNFLDKLDTPRRVRTTYQPCVGTGRTACVAGWTRLRTLRGHIPVADVQVGDLVFTHRKRWKRVLACWLKGVQPMYDLVLSNGEVLTCTADHRVLLCSGAWRTVRSVIDERKQDLDVRPRESEESACSLPFSGTVHDEGHCTYAGHSSAERVVCDEELLTSRGAQGAEDSSLLCLQARQEEPNAWEEARGASPLERRMRDRDGLHDVTSRGQKAASSSCCRGSGARYVRASEALAGASYRRGRYEQLHGQPGSSDAHRACVHSRLTGEGLQDVEVEKIYYSGDFQVYDISVEEDESYSALGVFHHNSRSFNIQQLPRDDDKPKHLHVRGCITPDPGWAFIIADYSQLELCALAHILNYLVRHYAKRSAQSKRFAEKMLGVRIGPTYESTLARAINSGQDCHVLMASVLRNESYAETNGIYRIADDKKDRRAPLTSAEKKVVEDRQLSKPANFGFPGGLGARAFVDYAAGYGVTIGSDTAQHARTAYLSTWIEMELYFWHFSQKCKKARDHAVVKQLHSGRLRGNCAYPRACNTMFQGLAADGAKEALGMLINHAYRVPSSPMFGTRPSGFVHDEFLVNTRREQADAALPEVERLMVEGMRKWIPDVKIKAPGKVLHERWSK